MAIWVVIFILIIAISVLITVFVLPRVYLKPFYTIAKSDDRCIKRVYETNGQSLVFEPEEKWRGIIKQYVLSERDNEKVVVCKVDKQLSYLEFEIVVFNAFNKVSQVIKENDYVDGSGYTKPVTLPQDASYVSVRVIRADNKVYGSWLTAKVSTGRKVGYVIVNSLTIIMEIIASKICLANILGKEFRESVVFNLNEALTSTILAGALILISTVAVLITVSYRNKKLQSR